MTEADDAVDEIETLSVDLFFWPYRLASLRAVCGSGVVDLRVSPSANSDKLVALLKERALRNLLFRDLDFSSDM